MNFGWDAWKPTRIFLGSLPERILVKKNSTVISTLNSELYIVWTCQILSPQITSCSFWKSCQMQWIWFSGKKVFKAKKNTHIVYRVSIILEILVYLDSWFHFKRMQWCFCWNIFTIISLFLSQGNTVFIYYYFIFLE